MCRPSNHALFMDRAIHEAKKSTMEHQLGAVIVKQNKIVATGRNCYAEHFNEAWSTHAELAAIMQLSKKPRKFFQDCSLYVVRVGTRHMGYPLKLSKPCESCEAVINAMGIKRVYYSTNEEFEEKCAQMGGANSRWLKLYRHANNHPMQPRQPRLSKAAVFGAMGAAPRNKSALFGQYGGMGAPKSVHGPPKVSLFGGQSPPKVSACAHGPSKSVAAR